MRTRTTGMNQILFMLALCLCLGLILGSFGCKKQSEPTATTPEPNSATTTPASNAVTTTPVSKTAAPTPPETPAPKPTASTPAETPAPTPAQTGPDTVAATVNGEVIGEREVDAIIDRNIQQNLRRMPGQVDPNQLAKFKEQMKPRVLDSLIMQRLLDQQVQAAHLTVTDQDVTTAMKERLVKYDPNMTLDKYKQIVESQGGNYQKVLGQFKKDMARQKFIESQWAGKVDVNDQEVRAYYDEHPDEFKTPEKVRASHILIKANTTDPNTDPNELKAARAKAEGLLAQIKAGADFAELAKANSEGPSAPRGGDLGAFERGRMVKPFSDAAFMLEPNQVSDVVETRFGYHIIKVTGRIPATTKSFDEAKAGIRENLETKKKRAFVQELLKSLKDRATIVYPKTEKPAAATPPAPTISVAPATSSTPADANGN